MGSRYRSDRGRTRLVRRSHFAAAIEGALADVRDELVIEMSSLEFMDCRGLDALAASPSDSAHATPGCAFVIAP